MEQTIIKLICIIVLLSVWSASAQNVAFPYLIRAKNYNLTLPSANPVITLYSVAQNETTPREALSVVLSKITEIRVPYKVCNFSTPSEFARSVYAQMTIVQSYSLGSIVFNATLVNQDNAKGLSFSTTLPNDSYLNFTVFHIPDRDLQVPIPRVYSDCSVPNPYTVPGPCSCDPYHTIKADSTKFSLELSNWNFTPVADPKTDFSAMLYTLSYIGKLDLDRYATVQDLAQLLYTNSCDLTSTNFQISSGVSIPTNLFTSGYIDGSPVNLGTLFIRSHLVLRGDGTVELPIDLFSTKFNRTFYYDPDLSILFGGGGNGDGGTADGGTGDGGTDGTSGKHGSDAKKDWVIPVAVVVPIVVVLTIVVLIAGVVLILVKKTKSRHKLTAAGSIASQASDL